MKVAIVTETFLPQTDGIVTRLCASIRTLRKEGHEVLVIAPDLGTEDFEGAKVVGIRGYSMFFYKDKKLALPSRKVLHHLREFGPDLVHVVNPAMLGPAGIYYAVRNKWPLVASYHTHIPKYADYYHVSFLKPAMWGYFRWLHNYADLNLCTSRAVMHELTEHGFKNVRLWKRGVDTDRFSPNRFDERMRQRLTNGNESKTLLLYVGRLASEKNLEALREVLESCEDVCLALVGDGPYRKHLENHFQGTDTVFTGYLHGMELARAYASSDVFVFPSTTETLGLVILEAMASGLPVVAANSGPTAEQIEDGVTGVLYEPEVDGSLVKKISLLKNEKFRAGLARAGREASRGRQWEEPSRQLIDFYEAVLEGRHLAARKKSSVLRKQQSE
ncbi:MAG TPA: glycosyltransferase family 1 protein [Bacillales bacterium]|nr:glycosyltransferase family 1 protein [Bacillales bacterium]